MKMANDMPQQLEGGGDRGSPRTAKGGVSNV